MEKKNRFKKPDPIVIKGIGKRGKNPHVNFNPGEQTRQVKEELLHERAVKVKAKSAKTGRTITRRFKNPEEAAKHYHKWLTSRRLKNVQLAAEEALINKANEYDLPVEMIQEVYDRSIETHPEVSNMTAEQWAFAGVNSFLEGGRAFDLNEDLITEARLYRITAKTSNKSLGKLSARKDALGKQAAAELARRKKAEKSKVYGNKKVAAKKLQSALTGQQTITPKIAAKLIATLKINPKTAVAKSLNKVANKHVEKKKLEKVIGKTLQSAEAKALARAANKAQKQKLEAKALKKQAAEKEARKQEKLAAAAKLARKEKRLKNQRLTARAAAAREREDAMAREQAEKIKNAVADALAKVKMPAEDPVKVKARPQPDVAKPAEKPTILQSVKKFFSKKGHSHSYDDEDSKPRHSYSTRVTHPKPPSTAKEEEDFIKRMESPLNGHLRTVRNLDMYRHLKAKRNPKPFNPEN